MLQIRDRDAQVVVSAEGVVGASGKEYAPVHLGPLRNNVASGSDRWLTAQQRLLSRDREERLERLFHDRSLA